MAKPRSARKRTRRAGGAAALPDDVLLDIFARVAPDFLDLLRCAATCRGWLRLVMAEPAFLRRAGLLPPPHQQPLSFPIGVFCQSGGFLFSAPRRMPKVSAWPPRFFSLRATDPGARRLSFTSFFPNDDGLFNYATPLSSSRGLLLLRLAPTPLDRRKLHLAVCHPLIGPQSTRLLPPPPLDLAPHLDGKDLTGYALLTPADYQRQRQQKTAAGFEFQVLITAVRSGDGLTHAYAYSSAAGRWGAPMECPKLASSGRFAVSGPRAGVVDGHGAAHWLYRKETARRRCFYTLAVAIRADAAPHVSLTKVPIKAAAASDDPPFPCVTGGGRGKTLSFVNARDGGRLELWTRRTEQDGGGGWLRSEVTTSKEVEIVAFAEGRGALLVKEPGRSQALFTLDLESKEMEPAGSGVGDDDDIPWRWWCHWCPGQLCKGRGKESRCDPRATNESVLYEMDWQSFLLHLCSAGSL